ncbi:MAG: ABC transporter ATP-binding protein [Ruminococcus sp.]|nr:ABC transporter ATP-binding protein [Ruminococcus sp.]
MIKFDSVTKVFNNTLTAVDDLSFQVNKGEIVGFIGPNGSGKTTTIKMLTGILKPDRGEISVKDFDIQKQPLEAKKHIGYIADNPDMFLRLKGVEFLNFISDIYRVPADVRKERFTSVCDRFGLTESLNSPMLGYSHGMRQKIMVAAALVHNPDVWILDEPLIGLDPKSAFELKNMMREHAQGGNCVFFSTHVLEVAEKLCDKVIIINKGKLLYNGTLENLENLNKGKTLEEIFLELTEK